MNNEFLTIHGIFDENSLTGFINLIELYRIIASLNLFAYYTKLMSHLDIVKDNDNNKKIDLKNLLSILNSMEFINELPLRSNFHPTYINILVLKAALIVYSKHLLK